MRQKKTEQLPLPLVTIIREGGLRPEECFRLRTENVTDGKIEIHYGKTDNARRQIPMTARVKATPRYAPVASKANGSPWVFPAQTKSGHIEPSTLKKQHLPPGGAFQSLHLWLEGLQLLALDAAALQEERSIRPNIPPILDLFHIFQKCRVSGRWLVTCGVSGVPHKQTQVYISFPSIRLCGHDAARPNSWNRTSRNHVDPQ